MLKVSEFIQKYHPWTIQFIYYLDGQYFKEVASIYAEEEALDTILEKADEGKEEEFESLIEEMYPDGLTDTELNDILWFDDDWIYSCLGIESLEEEEE